MSKTTDDFLTPPSILERVRAVGPIALDPCAGATAKTARVHVRPSRVDGFVIEHRRCDTAGDRGGLGVEWHRFVKPGEAVFVNPPYSRGHLMPWTTKCANQAAPVARAGAHLIALLPAAVGAAWAFASVYASAQAECRVRGRVSFIDPATGKADGSGRFWSWLVYWGPDPQRFFDAMDVRDEDGRPFGELGRLNAPTSRIRNQARNRKAMNDGGPVKASFFVPGKPVTQGSKRAFVIPGKNGARPRAIVTDVKHKELRSWRTTVAETALVALREQWGTKAIAPAASHVPVALSLTFLSRRPASHLGVTGALNATGRRRPKPTGRPDCTKLARSVEDALSKIVWDDDAQIVALSVRKDWTLGPEGVQVELTTFEAADVRAALDPATSAAIDELEATGR